MNPQSSKPKEPPSAQNTDIQDPQAAQTTDVQNPPAKATQSGEAVDPQTIHIHCPESMDHSSPPTIHIHYPQTPEPQARPIINVHFADNMTTYIVCPTCGSQMQDEDDEDGGNESTDGVNGSTDGGLPKMKEYHNPLTCWQATVTGVSGMLLIPIIMALALGFINFVTIPFDEHVSCLLHQTIALRAILQDL